MASTTNHKRKAAPHGSEPASKRSKPDYNTFVSVLLGEYKASFRVHKTTLCDRSPYFKAACSTRWQEGQDGVVTLPDHEAEIFAVYVHWVYTGELDFGLVADGESGPTESYEDLVDTWTLAHYLRSLELCNLVIDQMLELYDSNAESYIIPPETALSAIYNGTPNGSGIRRLVVDMACRVELDYVDEQSAMWPAEYVREAFRNFVSGKTREAMNPLKKGRCQYHEHDEGSAKCA